MTTANTKKSVHLSASAGSGKTRALKDRYLALLDALDSRGLNSDQAVAITFTDKAAAEIKERVMRGLPEAMLKKVIRGSQDLRISTIHSFCMNLLKRYPLEAGLPPDFGVLDSRDQAAKVLQAVEDALEASSRDREVMAPLAEFTADDLIEGLAFLLSIRSRIKRLEIDCNGPEGLVRAVSAGMAVAAAEEDVKTLLASPGWRASLEQMELLLRSADSWYEKHRGGTHLRLAGAQDLDSAAKLIDELAPLYFTVGGDPRKNPFMPKKACLGYDRAGYEKMFFQVQALAGAFRSLRARVRAGREALSLLTLFQRAEESYQNSKLREGLLDFDDLEIYAYGLLRGIESPDILYWLDRKVLHFLVDEFQDTSDIQWAILNRLTEELFAGQGADKSMQPTLFVVGDLKQSIYRFREANYRLIEDVRQKMEKGLLPEAREILTLDTNYRSSAAVIGAVNLVFSGLWGEAYQPSEADRRDQPGSVRLIELAAPSAGGDDGDNEAETLAKEIKALVAAGTTIYEKAAGDGLWRERGAGYGDCAVLIQSRTKLKEYEAALQAAGIPYRVIGGIGFYEEDEVQALMNVLFFLWNRGDRLALASALKSPLFGLAEQELSDLFSGDGDLVATLGRLQPAAAALLNRWMGFAGLVPLSTLLHELVEETGAYVRFGRRNPQALFNIDKLLDTAREFDRRGYTTLQDFVGWVRDLRETEQREATADMNLPGFRGSVSILTVHKAKGLEYPVVFLPGLNQQPKSLSTGPRALIEDSGGSVRMALRDAASPVYDELWAREQEELLREHQRLLYVAMTRARDHLVMLGTQAGGSKPVKQNTWLEYLHRTAPLKEREAGAEAAGALVYFWPEWQAGPLADGRSGTAVPRQEAKEAQDCDAAAISEGLAPAPRSKTPEWKNATDFIAPEKRSEPAKPALQGRAGSISPLTRGSLLHRCLEEFTKTGTYDISALIGEYPDLLDLGDGGRQALRDDAASVLEQVLNNAELRWIFEQNASAWSELPFLYRKGGALVSGIIDRVVLRNGRGYVVDYKAILLEQEQDAAAWLDHYRPQLEIYCEAVRDIFGLTWAEGHLLFLDSNRLELCTVLESPPSVAPENS